jgi:4-hydroxy-tetrahydrodipicolinate synthase
MDRGDWTGIVPAALTMFAPSGAIDDDLMGAHLDRLVGEGVDGLVVGGTSGEFIGLTDAERRHLIDIAVAAVGGRIPLIVGTGHFSTAETIALTEYAAAAGADGAIVILPYFQRPSKREVLEHYRALGRAVGLPVMLYNNPTNSAAPGLDATDLRTLFDEGHIVAVKSTFPTVHEVHEARAETGGRLRVFYGSFMAPLEGLAGGADGWISGILNVVAPDAISMWRAVRANDLRAAQDAWRDILPIKSLYTRGTVGAVSDLAIYRSILRSRGAPAGFCRPPLLDLSPAQAAIVHATLGSVGPRASP